MTDSDGPEHGAYGDWPAGPKRRGRRGANSPLTSARRRLTSPVRKGCFELEVSGGHELRDDREFLDDVAIADDFDACPDCGALIGGDTDGE